MPTPAQTLLAKMWDAGLLMHSLSSAEGARLTLEDGTSIRLTVEESSLFYVCTEHNGVLAVGDDRCQSCQSAALLAKVMRPAGHPDHPHGAPERWREDGKCIWKSCKVHREVQTS